MSVSLSGAIAQERGLTLRMKTTWSRHILCLVLVSLFQCSIAQSQELKNAKVFLDVPIVDLPENSKSYFPNLYSMQQSMAFSNDFYITAHSLIGGAPTPENRSRIWWILGFDLMSSYFPLGNSWLHEEWHRSVMSNRGIGSFNDVNLIPFGKSVIAVSQVSDEDLVRLKRDHPADQVRLSSAGMESQVNQNLEIEKLHFFHGLKTRDQVLLWMNNLNVFFYLSTCSSGAADQSTDEQNQDDGADIPKRDFTGLDCTAWVYDLFRPDEPYTARGTHPSGVGIDRYIRYSDLNDKEKSFLQKQATLSLLNLVDPFLFRKDFFESEVLGKKIRWNGKLSHTVTSFGATVDTHLFLQTEDEKYLLTWHHGMTDTRYLPGFSFEWVETALPWDSFFLSSGLTVWQQPENQRLETSKSDWVVHTEMELLYRLNSVWAPYLEFEAKTPGWIAGNVFLDRNFLVRTGVKATLF